MSRCTHVVTQDSDVDLHLYDCILVNATQQNITITIADAPTSGRHFMVKRVDNVPEHTVTVQSAPSIGINGQPSIVLVPGEGHDLTGCGKHWWSVPYFPPVTNNNVAPPTIVQSFNFGGFHTSHCGNGVNLLAAGVSDPSKDFVTVGVIIYRAPAPTYKAQSCAFYYQTSQPKKQWNFRIFRPATNTVILSSSSLASVDGTLEQVTQFTNPFPTAPAPAAPEPLLLQVQCINPSHRQTTISSSNKKSNAVGGGGTKDDNENTDKFSVLALDIVFNLIT